MNNINLNSCKLTKLSQLNLITLCELSNFKPNELERLYIDYNQLLNLNFIKPNTPFVNLKELSIGYNNITDISNIIYLPNLTYLDIKGLYLNDDEKTINLLKTMKNLVSINCYDTLHGYTTLRLKQLLPNIKNIL